MENRSAVRRKGSPAHRSGDHVRQVKHPNPRQWPGGGREWPKWTVPDPFDRDQRLGGDRAPLRMISPCRRRHQRRGGATSGQDRVHHLGRRSACDGGRDVVAQYRSDGGLVVRVVAVQAEPAVGGAVVAGQGCPQVADRGAVDEQVPFAAEGLGRVPQVDRHLTRVGPPVPQQVGGDGRDPADAPRGQVRHPVRPRHDPFVADEPHGRFATSSAGSTRVPV
ncbi:hypothetical protein [Actinokineospora globicatena]|uniref:hypothetical protein n=1 Tax=Actinokineospora globicatena TaxID=103729 RepID=UPI0025565E71|nr:hypothetical protein [Actinokineospora globicatena]